MCIDAASFYFALVIVFSDSTQLPGSSSTFLGFAGSFSSKGVDAPVTRTVVRASWLPSKLMSTGSTIVQLGPALSCFTTPLRGTGEGHPTTGSSAAPNAVLRSIRRLPDDANP